MRSWHGMASSRRLGFLCYAVVIYAQIWYRNNDESRDLGNRNSLEQIHITKIDAQHVL